MAVQPTFAAQAVNVQYIHDYIYQVHGITVPIKTTTPLQIANVKYLLCAVDKTNSLCGGATTSYCTHALATQQVVDTVATIDAVNRLVQCAPVPVACRTMVGTDKNEVDLTDCTGINIGGQSVSRISVGGYCSSTRGSGRYDTPTPQPCPGCQPATSGAGLYCYCKIHKINGTAVAPSERFVYFNNIEASASLCAEQCTGYCVWYSVYHQLLPGLLAALGN